ncbi:hypothetical protein [Halapricum hydrolyticum]|uniref:Uncharacterized protein n=1 Tax=Halapricum hydrolyticum TaxID=2979991 RepID=A0AAE3LFU2_9EURY|nr:hypothetical protein [Halapricum hydrolyticum]MCU4719334.1 hypothetical protein [Halapricum hydrolyticum]MCU4728221.1 hypothetical protein [Halapricum hydrolyticum]
MSLLQRSLPLVGILYLVYLVLQPPPLRWIGVICLAVVMPFAVGWLAGRLLGIGPWATEP